MTRMLCFQLGTTTLCMRIINYPCSNFMFSKQTICTEKDLSICEYYLFGMYICGHVRGMHMCGCEKKSNSHQHPPPNMCDSGLKLVIRLSREHLYPQLFHFHALQFSLEIA